MTDQHDVTARGILSKNVSAARQPNAVKWKRSQSVSPLPSAPPTRPASGTCGRRK